MFPASFCPRTVALCALVVLSGCLGTAGRPNRAVRPVDASSHRDVAAGPARDCRPALTGEPIFTEVLARPGGIDIDGDGKSTGRDEAIELLHDGDAAAYYQGVQLWIGGALRGTIVTADCLQPGDLMVLSGTTTAALSMANGAAQLRLDRPLQLPDGGGLLELRGLAATVLASVDLPQAATGTGTSLARDQDGDRLAPWRWHREIAAAAGATASIGRCLDGQPPCKCVAAQRAQCERERPQRSARDDDPASL